MIRATIAPAPGEQARGVLHLAVPVTAYGVECIADGALGGGGVTMELPRGTSDVVRARVAALVPTLRRCGLEVLIRGGDVEGIAVLAPDQLPGQASG